MAPRKPSGEERRREKLDRKLEAFGLLNYQTQGLSASEIAKRYKEFNESTGVRVQAWESPAPPTIVTPRSSVAGEPSSTPVIPTPTQGTVPSLPPVGDDEKRPDRSYVVPAIPARPSVTLTETSGVSQALSGQAAAGDVEFWRTDPIFLNDLINLVNDKPVSVEGPAGYIRSGQGQKKAAPYAVGGGNYIPITKTFLQNVINPQALEARKDAAGTPLPEGTARLAQKMAAPYAKEGGLYRNEIVQPRYTIIEGPDGNPTFIYREASKVTEEAVDQYLDSINASWIERTLMKVPYSLSSFFLDNPLGIALAGGSLLLKEAITDDNAHPLGALANYAYQSIAAGVTGLNYLRVRFAPLTDVYINGIDTFADGLENQLLANEGDAAIPANREKLIETIASLRNYAEKKRNEEQTTRDTFEKFKLGMQNAWDTYERSDAEFSGLRDNLDFSRNSRFGSPDSKQFTDIKEVEEAERKKYLESSLVLEDKARNAYLEADDIARVSADQAKVDKLFSSAVEYQKQAILERRKSDTADEYGAYSWAGDPVAYDKFITAIAQFELQNGRKATEFEIRQVRELYANVWTEASGEFIFDATWLLGPPLKAMNAVLKTAIPKSVSRALKVVSESRVAKATVRGADALKETKVAKGIERTAIVQWLKSEDSAFLRLRGASFSTQANKAGIFVADATNKISKSYRTTDEVVEGIDDLGAIADEVFKSVNPEDTFNALRAADRAGAPAAQSITFRQLKKMHDAGEGLTGATWGKMYLESVERVKGTVLKAAAEAELVNSNLTGELLEEAIKELVEKKARDPRNAFEFTLDFAKKFQENILEKHRVLPAMFDKKTGKRLDAGILMKDTPLGWIASKTIKGENITVARRINEMASFFQTIKSLWTGLILTMRPGYTIYNMIDSMGREAIDGGNLVDDFFSILTFSHSEFADDLGQIPIELSQQMAREGIPLENAIITRALYEKWKPTFGIFSYMGYEFDRLQRGARVAQLTGTSKVGALKSTVQNALASVGGGLADFNTSIEFTLRLKMFHRKYMEKLKYLEGGVLEEALQGLPEYERTLMKQVWKESRSNPARMVSLVESLTDPNRPFRYNEILPENFGKSMGENAELFRQFIGKDLEEFVQSTVAAKGRLPNADESGTFIDEMVTKFQNEYQKRAAATVKLKNIDLDMNLDRKITDMESAFANPLEETAAFKKAVADVEEAGTAVPVMNEGIERFAAVMRTQDGVSVKAVDGAGYKVSKDGDNIVIELGQDLKGDALKEAVFNSTMDAVKIRDRFYILGNDFTSLAKGGDYDVALKEFMENPLAMRNNRPGEFMAIANQMEGSPEMWAALKASGLNVQDYADALENFRRYGALDDVANMSPTQYRRWREATSRTSTERAKAGGRTRGVNADFAINLGKLREGLGTLPPEAAAAHEAAAVLTEKFGALRQEWQDFLFFVFPGHGNEINKGNPALVEAWAKMDVQMWDAETKFKQELLDMLNAGDYNKLAERATKFNTESATEFLRLQGVDVTWDAASARITKGTILRDNGNVTSMLGQERQAIEKAFFQDNKYGEMKIPSIARLAPGDVSLRKQFMQELRKTMGMDARTSGAVMRAIDNQAKWAAEYGVTAEEYYGRFGFLDGTLPQGGKYQDTLRVSADGSITFFGGKNTDLPEFIQDTSAIFLDDMLMIARKNPESAIGTQLEELRSFISAMDNNTEVNLRALTENQRTILKTAFREYIIDGSVKGKGVTRKPFESYKGWLSRLYGGVKDTPLERELFGKVSTTLDSIFRAEKMNAPTSTRLVEQIIKEMAPGLDAADVVNNVGIAKPKGILVDVLDEELFNEYMKTDAGRLLRQWQSYGSIEQIAKAKRELRETLENNPELRDQWIANARAYLDEKYPGTDTITLTRKVSPPASGSKDDFKWLPYDSLSDLPEGAKFNGYLIKVKIPKDNVLTSVRDNPVLYRGLSSEGEFILNERGWRGAEIIDDASGGWFTDSLEAWKKNNPQIISAAAADLTPDQILSTILKMQDGVSTSKTAETVNNAFKTWKKGGDWAGLPEDALQSPSSLRTFLKNRLADMSTTEEMATVYRRKLWALEQFNEALADFAGAPGRKVKIPVLKSYQMSDGARRWVRESNRANTMFEQGMQEINKLKSWMADGKYRLETPPEESMGLLRNAALKASDLKARMVDTLVNGGEIQGKSVTGAIADTNKVMIDYNSNSRFDGLMKNIFPFWTFPTRSLPFWAETLATNPQIIAIYQKVKRFSSAQQRQEGMTTSNGQQLPGMRGYVNIPGTEMWFNPLAPLSFSFILNATNKEDRDFQNAMDTDSGVPPQAYLAKSLLEQSPLYGFSMAPWTVWLAKSAFDISDDVLPQFPVLPQLSLMPRWLIGDMIEKGGLLSRVTNRMYPEVPWHDYLVEKDMLELANQKIVGMNDTDALAYMTEVRKAIKEKGDNPIWKEAYKRTTTQESFQSASAYFMGYYVKQFGDMEVDLIALRNQNNLMKSSLNNKFQSWLFDIPIDADLAWEQYNDYKETPEGWLYRTYADISYVTNERGQYVRDPKERAKLLATKLDLEEQQQKYYFELEEANKRKEARLKAVGIGAEYGQYAAVYEEYYKKLDEIRDLSTYDSKYGTNAPIEIIQRRMEDEWYSYLWNSRPIYGVLEGETYEQWQARVVKWETDIAQMAPRLMLGFQGTGYIRSLRETLKPDQVLPDDFYGTLTRTVAPIDFQRWQRRNDSVLDALNAAWAEMYWRPYWDTVGSLSGYQREQAERDFLKNVPVPDTQALYTWVETNYANRFSLDEVQKWTEYEDTSIYDLPRRFTEEYGDDYLIRKEIWQLLNSAGPSQGKDIRISLPATQDRVTVSNWYETGGRLEFDTMEELVAFRDQIKETVTRLGVSPTDEDYARYVEAEQSKALFEEYVARRVNISVPELNLIMDDYFNSGYKDYKKLLPREFAIAKEYFRLQDAWAYQNPVYAAFYQPGSGLQPSRPSTDPEQRDAYSPPDGDVEYPGTMKDIIGPELRSEIGYLYTYGVTLSPEAQNYLKYLTQGHPEWSSFIAGVIADNDNAASTSP